MLMNELLNTIFDARPHTLTPSLTTWLSASRRFATFVTTNRDKIRKKLRVAQDPEAVMDVRLELETAYLLLQERTLNLVYEPQLSGQSRRPDFAVTYTTSLTFMLEVTRQRTMLSATPDEVTEATSYMLGERLADTVCSKLGQLLPQRSNVLLVGVEALHLTPDDLRAALLRLQQRVERNDAVLLQKYRFRDRADFFSQYQRLSEIVVRGPQVQDGEGGIVWVNSQARYPLPVKVRTPFYRSHNCFL